MTSTSRTRLGLAALALLCVPAPCASGDAAAPRRASRSPSSAPSEMKASSRRWSACACGDTGVGTPQAARGPPRLRDTSPRSGLDRLGGSRTSRGQLDPPGDPRGQTSGVEQRPSPRWLSRATWAPPGARAPARSVDHPAVEVDDVEALLGEVVGRLHRAAADLAHHEHPPVRHLVTPLRQLHQRHVDGTLDVAVRPLLRLAHVEHRPPLGQWVGQRVDGGARDVGVHHGAQLTSGGGTCGGRPAACRRSGTSDSTEGWSRRSSPRARCHRRPGTPGRRGRGRRGGSSSRP